MAYCHECGEEIGEAEGFCPFCGITLKPSVVIEEEQGAENESVHEIVEENAEVIPENPLETAETDVDLSMSETVMVNPEDLKAEIPGSAENVSPLASETYEKSIHEDKSEIQANPIIETVESENLNDFDKPEFSDIPIKEQLKSEFSDISVEKDEVFQNPVIPEKSLESEIENVPETSANKDSELPSNSGIVNEIASNKSEVAKSVEPEILSDVPESDNFSDGEIAKDLEFNATIPYVPPMDKPVKEVASELNVEKEKDVDNLLEIDASESTPVETAANENIKVEEVEFNKDSSVEVEKPESVDIETISKPNAEDDFAKKPLGIDDEPITIIQGSKDLNPSKFTENAPEKKNAADEEVISSTTPNINATDTGGKSAQLKPLDEGTVLNGRYEVVRKIGGGGMGAVYLASDKNLGGVLRAVKEMVQSYIEEEQQDKAIKDFKRESMLLTSLEHTSIPTIYDYFFDENEGRFYLVMKYISGGDLAARLKAAPEGRLDEKSVVEWGIQISDVLRYLHNRQPPIVYRDLKPANIMIDGNSDRVMLIDFGIARWINKEEKGVTAVGTMGYAPPELFSGNVEARSDVYSLGSTMFHLLTGADPQSNPLLIFDFQKHPRPRQINPNLSDQIERILMKAVEYSADKRFASAEKMHDALIKHLEFLNLGRITYGITQTPSPVGLEEQPVFCGFCGQKIVASDMFCAFCGAKQPLAQPGVHSQEYVHTKLTARLVISGTSELDSSAFTLEKKDNLVGRRDPLSNIFPEVDLSKYDPQTKISRKHARIWRDGDNYLLEDLGSSNGTYLISQTKDTFKLLPNQAEMLTDGDSIKLGDTTLQFVVH